MAKRAKRIVDELVSEAGISEETYVSRVDGVSFYGQPDIIGGSAEITWSTSVDIRSWGIKSITPTPTKAVLSVEVESYGEEDRPQHQRKDMVIEQGKDGWKIEAEVEKTSYAGSVILYPQTVEVHVPNRKVVVYY